VSLRTRSSRRFQDCGQSVRPFFWTALTRARTESVDGKTKNPLGDRSIAHSLKCLDREYNSLHRTLFARGVPSPPGRFRTACAPRPSLAASSTFDNGRKFTATKGGGRRPLLVESGHRSRETCEGRKYTTTEEGGQRSLLVETGHRSRESCEGRSSYRTSQGRPCFRQLYSYQDQSVFASGPPCRQ
jgi:hypothetical protein